MMMCINENITKVGEMEGLRDGEIGIIRKIHKVGRISRYNFETSIVIVSAMVYGIGGGAGT